MKIRQLIILLFVCCCVEVNAQDIHFSQFYDAPINLNPALTGQFDGSYRFVGNYRRQWASIANPFVNSGVSVDAKNPLQFSGVGAGLSIYNDKAGTGELGTLQILGSFSYVLPLNSDSSTHISFGLQAGYNRRQVNFSKFSFDNQYVNGSYQPTAPTGEQFDFSSINYFDAHTGVQLTHAFNQVHSSKLGIAFHNLLKPNISFSNQDEDRLARRFTLHAQHEWKITEEWHALPRLLFMNQGPHREFTVGADARYVLDNRWFSYRAVYFGLYSRIVDAAILRVAVDYDTWHVGVSYDINYSKLDRASNARGGFEFSVIYLIHKVLPKRKSFKSCPDFI